MPRNGHYVINLVQGLLELDAKLTNERRMVDRDPDGKEVASSLDGL